METAAPMTERERRRNPRFERDDLQVTLLDPMENVIDDSPVLCDVSVSGLGLRTTARLAEGEKVRFRLALPDGPLAGFARVRWVMDTREAMVRQCGIEITDTGWGGSPRLESALNGGPAGRPFSWGSILDAALACGCVVVALLLFRDMGALQPEAMRQFTSSAGDTLPLFIVLGAALFGIVLQFRR